LQTDALERISRVRQSETLLKLVEVVCFSVVAVVLDTSCAGALPAKAGAVAEAEANDYLHTGPGLKGMGLAPRQRTMEQLNAEVRSHPNSTSPLLERGSWYLLDGDFDNGMADFDRALVVDPRCARAHIGKSRLYKGHNQTQMALAELQKAARLAPPNFAVDAVFESAFLHRELAQYPQALAEYDKVLKSGFLSKKRQAYAVFQRGEIYLRTGKFEAAIVDFCSALQKDPTLILAQLMRARAYTSLNDLKPALADYNAIISLGQKSQSAESDAVFSADLPAAFRERAAIFERLGRKDLALKDKAAAQNFERQTMDLAPFTRP
jgi:tetratricopeptide (TPR) repeat protein